MGNSPTKTFNTESTAANRFREWCLKDLASPDDFAKDYYDKLKLVIKSIKSDDDIEEFAGASRAVCCRDLLVCPKVEWYMYSVYSSAACLVCLLIAGIMWFTWNKMVVGAPRVSTTPGAFGGGTGTTGTNGTGTKPTGF